MKNKNKFLLLLLLMISLLMGCEDNTSTKVKDLKLHDLYSEKMQSDSNSNRIYIKENDVMTPYIIVTNNYNNNYLLMREFLLDEPMRFNANGHYSAYYEDSEVDTFLNSVFFESLEDNVKRNIVESTIEITNKNSMGVNGKDLSNIRRKIFLLSYHEVNGENSRITVNEGVPLSYFNNNLSRIALYSNGNKGSWWLRTPSTADDNIINGISDTGILGVSGIAGLEGEYVNGIRPVFCLDGNLDIIEDVVNGKTVYVLKN